MAEGVQESQPVLEEEGILRKIQLQRVFLEESGFDKRKNAITGTVRVANLAHKKRVQVRYTFDGWNTPCPDLYLIWEGGVGDKTTDRFGLVIPLPDAEWSGTVEFAIKYEVNCQTFWDNNKKKNYEEVVSRLQL